MVSDIREFVESCPTCQLEKMDDTLQKGSVMRHPFALFLDRWGQMGAPIQAHFGDNQAERFSVKNRSSSGVIPLG